MKVDSSSANTKVVVVENVNLSSRDTHISAMFSGRLPGMAVSPLPLQSTILLLQVHMTGQEPEARLHVCGLELSE